MILNEYILALGAVPFLFAGKSKRIASLMVLSILSLFYGGISVCLMAGIQTDAIFAQSLTLTPLSAVFSMLFCLGIIPTLLVSEHDNNKPQLNLSVFYSGIVILLVSLHGLLQTSIEGSLFDFIFYWELIALSSFMVMALEFDKRESFHSAIMYFATMHLCLFFILGGFITSGSGTGTLFATGTMPFISWVLLLVGFSLKSAIFPFSFWLPQAYRAATSIGAALMSCTSTNIGIFGIYMATLNVSDVQSSSITLMTVGAISALLGSLRIVRTGRLSTLLAFSSIESLGLVVFGIGFSFYAREHGQNLISIMAMASALLRLFSHGIGKALLLSIGGAVSSVAGSDNISELRAYCRRRPILSGGFFIGALSLSSAPIFGSFVSEFLLFFALLSGVAVASLSTISLLGVVILALCSTSVAFGMIKAFGIGFLGTETTKTVHQKSSRRRRAIGYTIFATTLCFGVWALAYVLLSNSQQFFLLSSLEMESLWDSLLRVGMIALLVVAISAALWALRYLLTRNATARTAPTWECGYGEPNNSNATTLPCAESFSYEAQNLTALHLKTKAKVSQRKVQRRISPLMIMRRWTSRLALFHTGKVSHYIGHILWFMALILLLTLFEVL